MNSVYKFVQQFYRHFEMLHEMYIAPLYSRTKIPSHLDHITLTLGHGDIRPRAQIISKESMLTSNSLQHNQFMCKCTIMMCVCIILQRIFYYHFCAAWILVNQVKRVVPSQIKCRQLLIIVMFTTII